MDIYIITLQQQTGRSTVEMWHLRGNNSAVVRSNYYFVGQVEKELIATFSSNLHLSWENLQTINAAFWQRHRHIAPCIQNWNLPITTTAFQSWLQSYSTWVILSGANKLGGYIIQHAGSAVQTVGLQCGTDFFLIFLKFYSLKSFFPATFCIDLGSKLKIYGLEGILSLRFLPLDLLWFFLTL